LLLRIFEGRFNRLLFKWIHPDIGVRFGLLLSNKHRYTKRYLTGKDKNIIAENELLYKYASDIARKNPDIDYLIYGHRHIPLTKELNNGKLFVLLGDWIMNYTYGIIDETGNFYLKKYES
jgi:UDP-2,3-diacylglucosamine hydrolase